mgnify:CR=1 FL=1
MGLPQKEQGLSVLTPILPPAASTTARQLSNFAQLVIASLPVNKESVYIVIVVVADVVTIPAEIVAD